MTNIVLNNNNIKPNNNDIVLVGGSFPVPVSYFQPNYIRFISDDVLFEQVLDYLLVVFFETDAPERRREEEHTSKFVQLFCSEIKRTYADVSLEYIFETLRKSNYKPASMTGYCPPVTPQILIQTLKEAGIQKTSYDNLQKAMSDYEEDKQAIIDCQKKAEYEANRPQIIRNNCNKAYRDWLDGNFSHITPYDWRQAYEHLSIKEPFTAEQREALRTKAITELKREERKAVQNEFRTAGMFVYTTNLNRINEVASKNNKVEAKIDELLAIGRFTSKAKESGVETPYEKRARLRKEEEQERKQFFENLKKENKNKSNNENLINHAKINSPNS